MFRLLFDARSLIAMLVSATVGTWGVLVYPWPPDNVFLDIIALRDPWVFHVFGYAYATCWFTTPFLAASFVLSVLAIAVSHRLPAARVRALPSYPRPETRPTPML